MSEIATKLMVHTVAGYPDLERSRLVAKALVAGGADYMEVQFPYSDPTSDGPIIEKASQAALDGGFRVDAGFELMSRLRQEVDIPLFIMTYGSLVFARGVAKFCDDAVAAGMTGLIIPDLPPDYSENLFAEGGKRGLCIVPVIAPEISDARLKVMADLKPEYIYTALRLGITGSKTQLDEGTIRYLDKVAGLGAKVIAGFGVRSREQMAALSGHAHAAAVGSFFLERLNAVMAEGGDIAGAMTAAARELK